MSKSILVIDVPDKYSDRDIYVLHEIYTYEGNRYERIEEYKEGVIKAKPMPERMKADYDTIATCEVTEKVVAIGWNACIKTILGEEQYESK